MNRRVTPPERITSPTWGPPPPCKQASVRASRVFVHLFAVTARERRENA